MNDKDNIKVTPLRLAILSVLLVVTFGLAIHMLGSSPLATVAHNIAEKLESLSADPAMPRALPADLCVINGKPLVPELDYIGYGSSPGLVLKYINTDGNLVLLGEKQILGVYEGDFCTSESKAVQP